MEKILQYYKKNKKDLQHHDIEKMNQLLQMIDSEFIETEFNDLIHIYDKINGIKINLELEIFF